MTTQANISSISANINASIDCDLVLFSEIPILDLTALFHPTSCSDINHMTWCHIRIIVVSECLPCSMHVIQLYDYVINRFCNHGIADQLRHNTNRNGRKSALLSPILRTSTSTLHQ